MPRSQSVRKVCAAATGAPTTWVISNPVSKVPSSGRISTGLSPCNCLGSGIRRFMKSVPYPAMNPATMPPRKPVPMFAASRPPIMPGAMPGRSAME